LSGIAQQYSQYRIRGMVFHYVPSSGNAVSSTNAALGTVMLQTSYRASEDAPRNKIELLNEYWSSESKPDMEFCHPIECDPKENPFNVQYVRYGALPPTENQLMYDLGRTTVAVSGQQANGFVLGDLWVTYEIELKKPVIPGSLNSEIQTYAARSITGTPSSSIPFAGTIKTTFNSFELAPEFTLNGIKMPFGALGTFLIIVYFEGATAFNAATATVTGGKRVPLVAGASEIASEYTVGTGMATSQVCVEMYDPAALCTVTMPVNALSGATSWRIVITEINGAARTD
jgi:hypothetical protein